MSTHTRLAARRVTARAGRAVTVPRVVRRRMHLVVLGMVAACHLVGSGRELGAQATSHLTPTTRIPVDPALRTGTLPNGLRYYIRHNGTPQGRAEFRLVVNAGSVLEDDDQRGLAHFVEHLAFNGSTHFPHQGIVDYIERSGLVFGNDLNAGTGYDETSYDLSLPAEPAMLDTALLILEDWAHGVTMAPDAVEKERGIIFEERRLHQGPQEKTEDLHAPVLYGSRYATRSPIGLGETILHAPRSAIWRFYRDWYRPDLETVIAVGDFDVRTMEAKIITEFGRLPKARAPRPRPSIRVATYTAPVASVVTDADISDWTAQIIVPRVEPDTVPTVGRLRREVVNDLFAHILNDRFRVLAQPKHSPITRATIDTSTLGRTQPVYRIDLTAAEPTTLELGITAVMAELARLSRDGVAPPELARARQVLTDQVTSQTLPGYGWPSRALVQTYVQSALSGEAPTDLRAEAALTLSLLPTITPADLQRVATAMLTARGPIVLATVPKESSYGIPERSELLDALQLGAARVLPPYRETDLDASLLATPPTAGRIVHQRVVDDLGVTEWILSNGARVLLKPTPFQKDHLSINAIGLGGTSIASDHNYANASVASTLVRASGFGQYDAKALRQRLMGLVDNWGTEVAAYTERAGVSGSPRHASTLFQLLDLLFTAPRLDSAAVTKWRGEARRQGLDPFQLEVNRLLAQRHPRARPIAGPIADSVDADSALAFYRARFGDAGRFTFVLVGDFNVDSIRPLVESYLGGLPGHAVDPTDPAAVAAASAHDLGIRPSPGVVQHSVVGEDSMSTVQTIFDAPMPYSLQADAIMQAIQAILDRRVRLRLREQLSGAYSPAVQLDLTNVPYAHATAMFQFTSGPERADELERALLAVVDTFTTAGVTPADLREIQQLLRRRRDAEAQSNGAWAQLLLSSVERKQSLDDVAAWRRQVAQVTPAMIREAARTLFDPHHYIVVSKIPVRLVPSRRDELLSAHQW